LETGRRTATYKLATLMALVDYCTEHLPLDERATLDVSVRDLAARVLDLYWYQVRPFEERELRQVKGSKANILDAVRELRTATAVGISHTALAVARARNEAAYQDALDKITVSLAEQPLRRLQTIQSMPSMDRFLYDDSFLKEHMSLKRLAAHGGAIRLRPGVAHGLMGIDRRAVEGVIATIEGC
jgi:hypothetical protein